MSLSGDLANAVFQKTAKAERTRFEKGIGPVIGSKRLIRNRTVYSNDKGHQMWVLFCVFVMCIPLMMVSMEMKEYEEITGGVRFLFQLLTLCYGASVFMVYALDLDAAECYFRGFKKSIYALATGVSKSELKCNKGLIGEYKSYVLSRSLNIPHKILFNVCIPMPNGNFQEVDAILITRNIIYVLECKNRGGKFVGKIDEPKWTQYIGRQQNDTGNIYEQNQKHTMALDRFLLDKGIIQNGQNVCINTIFSVGDMSLECDRVPLDFLYGNMRQIRGYIEKNDKNFDDGTDTTGIMERVYEALLPYALYNQQERQAMIEERTIRSKGPEFALGDFRNNVISEGIPGITKPGESAIIRYNKVYTQLLIRNNNKTCWQTRTDIPDKYTR